MKYDDLIEVVAQNTKIPEGMLLASIVNVDGKLSFTPGTSPVVKAEIAVAFRECVEEEITELFGQIEEMASLVGRECFCVLQNRGQKGDKAATVLHSLSKAPGAGEDDTIDKASQQCNNFLLATMSLDKSEFSSFSCW